MQIELHVIPIAVSRRKRTWGLIVTSPTGAVRATKQAAVKLARAIAIKHKLELVVHDRRGVIRSRDSHGYDSPRRKG